MNKTIDLREPIRQELSAKYEFRKLRDETSYATKANMVVDSFFPAIFNEKLGGDVISGYDHNFGAGAVAISKFTAMSLGVKHLHVSELLKILGVTDKYIKDVLLAVKRKELNLTLAGYGGTGINFNYWLSELAGWTDTVNIFNTIYVYDADNFSVSNLLRIPYMLEESLNNSILKIDQFDNTRHICKRIYLVSEYINSYYSLASNQLVYGAPSIEARQFMSSSPCVFVSATHQDDVCSLDLNPLQDNAIQMETYGKIDLSTFFVNHLVMTIKFMEWLADTDMNDLELAKKSEKIMDYRFEAKEYDGSRRMYRFPRGGVNV